MEEKEIISGNKLIVEFMGESIGKRSGIYTNLSLETGSPETPESLKYHNSWNALMPVVEKIDSLTMPNNIHLKINELDIFAELKVVYKAVIEFVEWYNKNKQST